MAPESVDLVVLPPAGGFFFSRLEVLGPDHPTQALLQVRPAGTLVLSDVRQDGFVFHGGVGIPLSRLLGWAAGRFETPATGGLQLPPAAEGLWLLCSGNDPRDPGCQSIDLVAGGHVVVGPPDPE